MPLKMPRRKPRVLERPIQNAILEYLNRVPGCVAFEIYNEPVYRQRLGTFIRNSKYRPKGIPDIHGMFRGRPFWIEVKSARGVLSREQRQMHEILRDAGAAVAVCRSVSETEAFVTTFEEG